MFQWRGFYLNSPWSFVSVGTKQQTARLQHSLSAENVTNGINNNFTTMPSPTASESSSSAGYSSNNPSINSEQSFNEEEEEEEGGWETDEDFYASDDDLLDSKEDGDIQEVGKLIDPEFEEW